MKKISYLSWASEYAEKNGVPKTEEEKLKAKQAWEAVQAMHAALSPEKIAPSPKNSDNSDHASQPKRSGLNRTILGSLLFIAFLWGAGQAEKYFKYNGMSQAQIDDTIAKERAARSRTKSASNEPQQVRSQEAQAVSSEVARCADAAVANGYHNAKCAYMFIDSCVKTGSKQEMSAYLSLDINSGAAQGNKFATCPNKPNTYEAAFNSAYSKADRF